MRVLFSALLALTLGCGPEDPQESVASQTAAVTRNDAAAKHELDEPLPPSPLHWEMFFTEAGLIFRLVQDPVEGRFRYPVELTQTPPAQPAPPCPACR